MKYACLVYHDETTLDALSKAEQLAAIVSECDAASAWTAELQKGATTFSRRAFNPLGLPELCANETAN